MRLYYRRRARAGDILALGALAAVIGAVGLVIAAIAALVVAIAIAAVVAALLVITVPPLKIRLLNRIIDSRASQVTRAAGAGSTALRTRPSRL